MLADAHGFARPKINILKNKPGWARTSSLKTPLAQRGVCLLLCIMQIGVVVQRLVYIHGMDGIGVRFSATPPQKESVSYNRLFSYTNEYV